MHQNCRCVGGLLVGTGVGRVGFRLVSLGFCFFTPPVTPLSQRGMPLMSAPLLSPPPPRTLPPIPKRALFSESQKLFSPLSPSLFFFSLYFSFSFIFLPPFFFFPFFFLFFPLFFFLNGSNPKKKKGKQKQNNLINQRGPAAFQHPVFLGQTGEFWCKADIHSENIYIYIAIYSAKMKRATFSRKKKNMHTALKTSRLHREANTYIYIYLYI